MGLGCVLRLCPRGPSSTPVDMPLLDYLHAEDLPSGPLLLSLHFPLSLSDPKQPHAPIEVFRYGPHTSCKSTCFVAAYQ